MATPDPHERLHKNSVEERGSDVASAVIRLRGVRTHNLRAINLDLPRGRFTVICGRCGSGKTSLAIDTLFAEGQRRYIESLSTQERQFLKLVERPEADLIEGLPPTVSLNRRSAPVSLRATVGSVTEIDNLLALLFARCANYHCPHCAVNITESRTANVLALLNDLPAETRLLLGFPARPPAETRGEALNEWLNSWRERGVLRAVRAGCILRLDDISAVPGLIQELTSSSELFFLVDRLTAPAGVNRLTDSLETCLQLGDGCAFAAVSGSSPQIGEPWRLDNTNWTRIPVSNGRKCPVCLTVLIPVEARLFLHEDPAGACLACEGLGWITGGDAHQAEGKSQVRKDSYPLCDACGGARIRPEGLSAQLAGKNFAELQALRVDKLLDWLNAFQAPEWLAASFAPVLGQLQSRLQILVNIGLAHLSLQRRIPTLASGESSRVMMAASLVSKLTGVLYILDEPTSGLHDHDAENIVGFLQGLRDRGNTVIVVDHSERLIMSADEVLELGPGSGPEGGAVVYQGPPNALLNLSGSITSEYLAGRMGRSLANAREPRQWINLRGARGRNLKNINVDIPLGVLCVVTGVSGAGKSSLTADTLCPAIVAKLKGEPSEGLPFQEIVGAHHVSEVVWMDQRMQSRSGRGNPVTFIKAFDEIRAAFSASPEAKIRGFTAAHFSVNSGPGRCPVCLGEGFIAVEMQFLPDVYMACQECEGARYRPEVLAVKIRDRSIDSVLQMTVRDAFSFFRGRAKIQAPLQKLMDLGLDYLRLGQRLDTLSGGEWQRLRLAQKLAESKSGRSLIVLEEPCRGLHFSDVSRLLESFKSLLAVGHSLVVIEHNLQLITQADYIIDMGPGPGEEGGQIVATGPPRQVLSNSQGYTALALQSWLSLETRSSAL